MKKALSIILSILMIFSTFAFAVVAEDEATRPVCACKNHIKATDELQNNCTCCVYCDNLDRTYVTSCVLNQLDSGKEIDFCCADCDGIYPCDCNCSCCNKDAENTPEQPPYGPILDEDQQAEVLKGFSKAMKKVMDFFDKFFNYIFEFLRFTEIMK